MRRGSRVRRCPIGHAAGRWPCSDRRCWRRMTRHGSCTRSFGPRLKRRWAAASVTGPIVARPGCCTPTRLRRGASPLTWPGCGPRVMAGCWRGCGRRRRRRRGQVRRVLRLACWAARWPSRRHPGSGPGCCGSGPRGGGRRARDGVRVPGGGAAAGRRPAERAEVALEIAETYAALFRWVDAVDVLERALAELGEADRVLAARLEGELVVCGLHDARRAGRVAPVLARLGSRRLEAAR